MHRCGGGLGLKLGKALACRCQPEGCAGPSCSWSVRGDAAPACGHAANPYRMWSGIGLRRAGLRERLRPGPVRRFAPGCEGLVTEQAWKGNHSPKHEYALWGPALPVCLTAGWHACCKEGLRQALQERSRIGPAQGCGFRDTFVAAFEYQEFPPISHDGRQ